MSKTEDTMVDLDKLLSFSGLLTCQSLIKVWSKDCSQVILEEMGEQKTTTSFKLYVRQSPCLIFYLNPLYVTSVLC